MVKRTSLVAVFVLAASAAYAQETPSQAPSAASAAPAAPARTDAAALNMQRIYHIRQIESMLTNAVKAGAASLANQLKISEPNSMFVTGNARARGFELEGYGVFFDVDVPTMMQSVLWSTQLLQQQQYAESLRQRLADPAIDPAARSVVNMELARMQRAMARGMIVPIPAVPTSQPAPQGLAVAQTTEAPAAPARRELAPVAPPPNPRSPDELYTDTIKDALIDAMLSYGSALQLGDEEWLTIAARATNQGTPGQLDDSSSIVIRVKGSDLSAFLKRQITREEILKKIEIKEG
jgi:hypothetical protein